MTKISSVTLTPFTFPAHNLAPSEPGSSIGGLFYAPGAKTDISKQAVCIETEDGCRGEYILDRSSSTIRKRSSL